MLLKLESKYANSIVTLYQKAISGVRCSTGKYFYNTINDASTDKFNDEYFYGFDYFRVILCAFIVAWHVKIFGWVSVFLNPDSSIGHLTLADIFYCNVFFIAVPLFLLISLFLYIRNRQNKPHYFVKRLKYLILIYIFWFFVNIADSSGGISIQKIFSISYITIGGGMVGYFLFVLIFLVIITEVLITLKQKMQSKKFLALISIFFVITLILIIFRTNLGTLSGSYRYYILQFTSPFNFLPYPFIAIYLSHYYQYNHHTGMRGKLTYILLLILIVLLISAEWLLLPDTANGLIDGLIIPPYARLSIVASTVLLFFIALQIHHKPPSIISEFAGLTMGIFLIHLFIMKYLIVIWPELYRLTTDSGLMYFLIIFFLSACISYFIKKIGII